jgi:glycerol-3-phosphate acyltransferase PlsY|tara:strand:- start:517 stop:1101 length:585 start_codon:yes stop_codon:yes gene_type:complete
MLPELIYLFILSYLIGSISTAIIVCKLLMIDDPRTQGSKNPGATNVLRIGGKKAAAVVLFGDALKGILPVLIAKYLDFNLLNISIIALSSFLGHVYPIFYKFRGGKGVATFIGSLFAINYLVGLCFAFTWIFVAKVLKVSSVSALVATFLTPIYFYLITNNLNSTYIICIICVWIFYTHRSNIKRIILGAEKRI